MGRLLGATKCNDVDDDVGQEGGTNPETSVVFITNTSSLGHLNTEHLQVWYLAQEYLGSAL